MSRLPAWIGQHLAAVRAIIVMTVITGAIYPLAMLGVAQAAFHNQANGSLVTVNGKVVGSSLLCQEFVDSKGNPLPQYFQPRPSDAVVNGGAGCNPLYSSASNLGPTNPVEISDIAAAQKAISAFDHVPVSQIPPDAVTASGSGLDPDITPANAYLQVDRIAAARHLPVAEVYNLVTQNITGRTLGFLGEPSVNVLLLNIKLDELPGQSGS